MLEIFKVNRKELLSDLSAGFTTGLFSLPEGMAYAKLRETGNLLLVAGVEYHVLELLERTEIINALGKENVFPAHRAMFESMDAAMDHAQSWISEKDWFAAFC